MNNDRTACLIKEHYTGTEIYVFIWNIRAYGKGSGTSTDAPKKRSALYPRLPARSRGPRYAQYQGTREKYHHLLVENYELDMLVLSVGLQADSELKKLSNLLNVSLTADGFMMEATPQAKPVDAPAGHLLRRSVEAPRISKEASPRPARPYRAARSYSTPRDQRRRR